MLVGKYLERDTIKVVKEGYGLVFENNIKSLVYKYIPRLFKNLYN